MHRTRYSVRLLGPVDRGGLAVLRDLDASVQSDGWVTVVDGRLDQAALHGLLERARVLGLVLDEVARVRPARPGAATRG